MLREKLLIDNFYSILSLFIFFILLYRLLFKSSDLFVFRELVLLLYAINYLISPMLTYMMDDINVLYPMKISYQNYFQLVIPGFLLFLIGVYCVPTKVFRLDFTNFGKYVSINETYLKRLTIAAFSIRFFAGFIPNELTYFLILFSLLRFVGAFSLLIISRKYWLWPLVVMLFEFGFAFILGMYHDALLWLIFFSILYAYLMKPGFFLKLFLLSCLVFFIFFVQSLKGFYRENVWNGDKEASLSTALSTGQDLISDDLVFSENNVLSTLNRANQAWILASTIDNMDRSKDFQGLNNVKLYLESAFMPRFLAPNKLKSGDQGIFNKFSGHNLSGGTAMGLGIFADGYVAYGGYGIAFFGLALGLIFSVVFKIVENWSRISPFYVLFLFPLLNYAVRPDCELQTTLTHIVKGLILYGFVVKITKFRFSF